MSHYRIRDVHRTETPFVLGDGDSLRIDPLGLLQMRVPGPAILLTGGTATIRYAGEITLSPGTPVIAGTLTTPFDIRIVTSASLPLFNNPGIALASDDGVGGTLHIRNSAGTVFGGGLAGSIDLSGLHADIVGIVNSGRISGGLSIVAYSGSMGTDLILNTGVIDGDVVLGDGDDRLHNSGLIAGRLLGGGGDDRIVGGQLNELIVGGTGRDVLAGGLGSDRFYFDGVADSAPDRAHADVIRDFDKASGDTLIFWDFDADTTVEGVQQLRFIGEAAFSGAAGELRCDLLRHGGAVISADVDGDAQADFTVVVWGDVHAVTDLQFNL